MLNEGQLISDWVRTVETIPERGDLLEFRRTADIGGSKRRIYTHWAVYIGKFDDLPRVVHISTPDGDFDGKLREMDARDSFLRIIKGSNVAEVRCDSLVEVAGEDLWRINNALDSTHLPFPPSIIVERATHKLGAGDYNLVTNNCEHFAKYCRYGNKISSQAIAAKSFALSSLLALGVNPGIAIGAGVLYALTSESVSQFLHKRFSTNFRFF